MTGRKETRTDFFRLVASQYPTRLGVLPQQIGNLRFAEISFDEMDSEAVESFLQKGLKFGDGSVVLPCRALGPKMEVISVRLSNLPFLNEKKLLDGLRKSLSHAIPKSFDSCYIDPFTCLSLPLSAVISSTPSTSSSHLSSTHVDTFRTPNLTPLLCSDLFYFDSLTLQLELCQPPLHQSRHPTLARQALQSILSGSISFLPFLQHNRQPAPRTAQPPSSSSGLSPFITSFTSLPSSFRHPPSSIRSYKFLTRSRSPLQPSLLATPTWKTFWSLAIPLQARTVWYRLLHRKIPCRSFLHQLIPSSFPSPLCPICSASDDTIDHFFFLCPAKASIWLTILTTYIHPLIRFVPSDVPRLLHCIYRFLPVTRIRDPSLPLSSLSQEQIFACTLLGIWQMNWRSIFDNKPFSPTATLNTINRHLHFLDNQRYI